MSELEALQKEAEDLLSGMITSESVKSFEIFAIKTLISIAYLRGQNKVLNEQLNK